MGERQPNRPPALPLLVAPRVTAVIAPGMTLATVALHTVVVIRHVITSVSQFLLGKTVAIAIPDSTAAAIEAIRATLFRETIRVVLLWDVQVRMSLLHVAVVTASLLLRELPQIGLPIGFGVSH